MADLLGTALSVGNGLSSSAQSNTDLLLEAFRRTKQADVDALKSKQTALESRQVFFNQLRTKLQSLQSKIDSFQQEGASSKFTRYTATSSDTTVLSITASSEALTGAVSVKVGRLATNDTLISDRKTLATAYTYAGETKTIVVGETSVDVTFAADDTNETALKRIANAFNAATDTTVTVSAALVKDTSTTGRLTFTSKNTGASYNLTFTDSEVLSDIGISEAALSPNTTARTLSTTTTAGYRVADFNDLSAKVDINGVEVVRDSNTVSDILPGLTFSFLKVQDASEQPATVTVGTDVDGVADSVIKPLLDAFNDITRFLRDSSSQLRGDSALRSLQSTLRGIFGQEITSATNGNPKFLSDAGITTDSIGQLSVSKKDALKELLQSDPQKVADLFVSADGFAAKLTGAIGGLLGNDGIITARSDSVQSQIKTVGSRTKQLQQRIDAQTESLRKEYQKLQKLYLDAQNQTALLNGFTY